MQSATCRASSVLVTRLSAALLLALAATVPAASAQEPWRTGAKPAATATAAPSTYGSITVRVMSDDGRPLSNITVMVMAAGSLVPSPPRTGATDSNGRIEFKNLSSGAYTVQVSAPSYVRLRDAEEERERAQRNYYRLGDSVTLTMTKGAAITGTVTDMMGRPVVAMRVRAVRVRDALGKPQRAATSFAREGQTDDRGIYRIWGLEPGGYLVSAGHNSGYFDFQTPINEDAPTYYPSATRDGATEVAVQYGDEQSGIDIRHRNERGRRVSGQIGGATDASGSYGDINVLLVHAASGLLDNISSIRAGEKTAFTFNSVTDGEYDVVARRGYGGDSAASAPLRIKVRGSDIDGLQLVLAPLGTISGRLVREAAPAAQPPACEETTGGPSARERALEETIIVARLDERESKQALSSFATNLDSQPRSDGEFFFGSLQPGRYHLDAKLPDERWYVRAITPDNRTAQVKAKAAPAARQSRTGDAAAPAAGTATTTAAQRAAVPGGGLSADGSVLIAQGTQATGIRIVLASGAAKLAGRVVSSTEGASLPPRLRLYLVPREAERADDLLRFAETNLHGDGTFTLSNLAPGRYLLLARPVTDQDAGDTTPLAWNAEARAELRRQAEAARQEIELGPCQKLTEASVRYMQSAPPVK